MTILANTVPTLEIRFGSRADEQSLRMVRYFLESLSEFGGPVGRKAHCVVSISPEGSRRDLQRECGWAAEHSVEFQWVDNDLFERASYHGTNVHRHRVASQADVVLLADVDLFVAGDFDRAILEAFHSQRLLGFIAHVSPFSPPDLSQVSSRRWWNRIFAAAGLPQPQLNRVHTGWGLLAPSDPRHRLCPDYFNYGFIVAPRQYVEQMGQTFEAELRAVDGVVETWFKSQIANTLAIARHQIPCGTLPINYNFPLHVPGDRIRALNPDPEGANRPEDVKIFHYLGDGEINKGHFATRASLEAILEGGGASPDGSVLGRKLRLVHEKIVSTVTPE